MALLITCPDCEAENRFADDKKGKTVPCKTCGVSFKVNDSAKYVEDVKKESKVDSDLDDEDKPKKKKSSRTDLDDEDEDKGKPKKRRRRDEDDDDEDDARRGRARGHTRVAGNSPAGIIVGVSLVGLLVIGGVIYLIVSSVNKVKEKVEEHTKAVFNPPNNNPKQSRIEELLGRVKAGDKHAMMDVTGTNPNVPQRAEMAKALEENLTHKDPYASMDAARALAKWGSKENVPAAVKALDHPYANPNEERGVRETIIAMLGDMKDPQAIKPLVDQIILHPEMRNKASESLRKIGSAAETDVQRLLTETDVDLQIVGCKILKDVGTQASGPMLEAIANTTKLAKDNKSRELNREAGNAAKAITLRKK